MRYDLWFTILVTTTLAARPRGHQRLRAPGAGLDEPRSAGSRAFGDRPRWLRTSAAVLWLACLTSESAGCVLEADVEGASSAIVDVDEELAAHFDDAALFCDLRVLQFPLVTGDADRLGDGALADYAATLRRLGTVRITTGPHADQPVGYDPNPATNACRFSTSTANGGDLSSQIEDGFCRADFNYCLGRELSLHAQSLPGGAAQTLLKAEILRRARERLQAAGLEYLASLAFYERMCVSEAGAPPTPYVFECSTRLLPSSGPSYLPTAHDRLVQSVAQIASLAQTEVALRVDVGDRALRETPPSDPNAPIQDLFGEEGSRTAGVSVLYGPPDGVRFETAWNHRRLYPVALPITAPGDERAARALELLRRYRVPTPFARDSPAGSLALVPGVDPRALYNLLDHRIAAERYRAPYDDVVPADPASDLGTILRSRRALAESEVDYLTIPPFSPHTSILRTEHQITQEDVRRALLLAADTYETQFGRFVFEPQIHGGEPGEPVSGAHYLGLLEASGTARPSRMLASAFSEEEAGPTTADALAPLLSPMPSSMRGRAPGDWYAWDLRRVDATQEQHVAGDIAAPLGAAGALHLMRVHLLRLAELPGTFIDTSKTSEALALIEQVIGGVWTEHDAHADALCDCFGGGDGNGGLPGDPLPIPGLPPPQFCPQRDDQALYGPCASCLCKLAPLGSPALLWEVYSPMDVEGEYAGGRPVVVYWVDDVRCLLQERRPGTDEPCTVVPTPVSTSVGPITTRVGRNRRTYGLPAAPSWATHHYVLWEDADGGYQLVDVFPVGSPVGVHPLGGVFLDAAADAWSRDPWRPEHTNASSSGAARALVPPLESELISDGDAYEDSFAQYLTDAHLAVALARDQLIQARDGELLSRQNELSTQARLEEAALVETAQLADMCGDLPDCRVNRAPPLTLRELGIVGPPPPEPDLAGTGYADCDEVLDRLFSDFTETIASGTLTSDAEAQQFVNDHMLRVLGCFMHQYLTELANLEIGALPSAVRDALASGSGGEFTTYSGEVREHLLSIFQTLDGARDDVRRLGTHRFAAEVLIDAAAHQISYASNDQLERDLCVWGFGLGVAADGLSIIASVLSAGSSYATASNAFGNAGAPGAPQSLYEGGMNNVRDGAQSTSRALSEGGSIANRVQGYLASDGCMNQDAATSAGYRAAQQVVASMQTLVALARRARDSSRSTFFAIWALDALQRRAELAGQRRAVARLQAESDSVADLPEWQSLLSFRQRRAQAALERAQQATFVARRAVEFRLAVDLTSMAAPEPLTPPPATWADSLFDVGAAVLTLPEDDRQVSIAAEELELYLNRLQRFVDGYPIARRFRDAGDVQILDIGAMLHTDPSTHITDQMLFKCSGSDVVLPGGRLPALPGAPPSGAAPCAGLGDVEYAEIFFTIPAELDTYLQDRLAAGSFNYRHEHLAPNFVGTGLLDCERAYDPAECYSDGNVPYSLRHEGPFVLENFDHELQTYQMEPGVIRSGRSLVAERSLTTPLSSTDRRLVSPFYREELRGRPLSGLYSLRVEGRPEVRWAALERIQLLLGYRYWTRQE